MCSDPCLCSVAAVVASSWTESTAAGEAASEAEAEADMAANSEGMVRGVDMAAGVSVLEWQVKRVCEQC